MQEEREFQKKSGSASGFARFHPNFESFHPRIRILPPPAAAAELTVPRLSWWEWGQIWTLAAPPAAPASRGQSDPADRSISSSSTFSLLACSARLLKRTEGFKNA